MKTSFVLCVIVYLSAAAPTPEDAQAKILSYESTNDGLGNYEFSFKTSNEIFRSETGRLVNVGQPDEHIEVQGFYTYEDTEGELVIVSYSADDNGFHVARAPPITKEAVPIEPTNFGLPSAAVATLLG